MDLTDKNFSPKELPDRKKRLAKGCTTLMYSCQQGKSDNIVTELRIKPKSVYRRDKSNKSALHYCCGQLDLVAAASVTLAAPDLLESADEDGLTPLHLAVIQGNMALVSLLLANKANVNAVDNEGHSVVHWAAVCGEVDALRALLAAGADITKTDLNGGSPLHYAAQMSNGSTYQSHSANLALEILEIFLQQPNMQVDVCDKDGRQPLLWAASAGAVKAVLLLVKAGARVESADKDGLTALHCAASRGHTECINVLINLCGAPIDLIDSNGCTALHYAVTLGHADATYMLLDLGADPNRQDRKGRTPAHCGCAKGQFETVKMLRDRKANMWLRNAKGDLPLHEAASSGRRELVLWLLDQRPKHVNTTSNDGRTILHIAAANDYTDMCKMLIDFGADINSIHRLPGNVVQTPLDSALSKGHRSTAKFLQIHGGLPANKLRLSGRNPNALNDQELVKPLTFSGDKKRTNDTENLKKTRSVWLYVDQSDTDANETDVKQSQKLADGSSQGNGTREKRKSRKPCGCHYHYYHHYRHRCRVRSNSCERIEILERDSGPDSAICRSKSNVEICLYHKRKPKYRRDISSRSASTGSSCSEDESCNSEHFHQSTRRKRKNYRGDEKSKPVPGKESDEKDKVIQKVPTNDQNKNDKKDRATKANDKKIRDVDQKADSDAQKAVKATEANENAPEQPVDASKEIAKATDADTIHAKTEVASVHKENQNVTGEATVVTVVADVHNSSDVTESVQRTELTVTQSSSLGKATESELNKENTMTEPTPTTNMESTPKETTKDAKEDVGKSEELVVRIEKRNSKEKLHTNKDKTETKKETKEGTKEETNENVTPVKSDCQEMPEESTPTVGTKATDKSTVEIKEAAVANDERENAQAQQNTGSTVADESEPTNDTSKTFQVLPIENQTSDKQINQEQDDEENLLPPKQTETIRKTSFTVLKSDESIDDLMVALEENLTNEQDNGKKEKPLSRPKSFKVLNAHDASGEDIILHQSSDQETAGNENDDDYLDGVAGQRSGKYSDSELMKMDGPLNGRRKKYKKRAKSVKQLTIMDRSQQSKDQDSGFEPSPRTIRSQKLSTTRTIYTAGLPERPRVGDIVDGRSMSSRYDQRKPGDKNAVNMSTVSQTLQRNIRRYYMEHKIFQHLLELKSLQIRSSKMNESLLVKRAVDDYHKSTMELGSETGGTMRRYPYKEYTFKNFEIFLYEVLKSLQKNGSNNFQNISDVYLEAERRLSPDYSRCKKAMYCTSKTHRCLHAAHAYTGIPCAAYIPMMNHHTMPKYGFGKTSMGSFYLPKICNKGAGIDKCGSGNNSQNTVSLELSHGNNKQLITLPAEKLDNNKRYYVTFTLKENEQQSSSGNAPNGSSASELKK